MSTPNPAAPASATPLPATPIAPRRRKPLLLALAAAVVLGGGAYAGWWWLEGRYTEHTDDAYVAGNVITVSPQIAGTVQAVLAEDTELVQAGAPLLRLDDADARITLGQAEAALAQTVREVRTLFATNAALATQVASRESDLGKAREDLARREKLTATGAVSSEEAQHSRTTLRNAEAALAGMREQLAANRVLIEGTTVENHPNVLRAAARVEEAALALARTTVPAPVSGQVAKRAVQVGSRVSPGTPLLALVPLDQLWVDANFKEGQLHHMQAGQAVHLNADLYGSQVEYRGTVVGLGAGTGAAFALLPAQNATGNWIKVVQRVPVRIALDPADLAAHPLRVGLSMQVAVDVRGPGSGTPLAAEARRTPVAETAVYASQSAAAAERIRRIIAANLGDDEPAAHALPAVAPAKELAPSMVRSEPRRAATLVR